MGITLEQWQAVAPPEMHAMHPDAGGAPAPAALPPGVQAARQKPRAGTTKVNDKGQNKTEAAFDASLAHFLAHGRIDAYAWEPLKLRLGPRTWLTLDFAVKRKPPRHLALIDVKGGAWEDDAAAKTKIAAEMFAWLADIYIVRRSGRHGWEAWPVTPRGGLARQPITDDTWLWPSRA